ncbi:MAG: O-antigen ligase family protein [Gemmatimonadales bacterium]
MPAIGFVAVWMVVFAIPWENVLILPGVGTITRLLGMIAVGITLCVILVRGRLRKPGPFHWLALVFLLYSCASIYWTIDREETATRVWINLQLAALLWLIWEASSTATRRAALMQAYVFGAWVTCYQTYGMFRAGIGRVAGTRFAASENFNPNDMGFLLVLALPMAWHLSITYRSVLLRWINRLYIPAGLFTISLTGSRSGLILSGLTLCLVPWTLQQINLRIKVLTVAILAVGVALALTYAPTRTLERLMTTQTELTQGTLNDRTEIWRAGMEVLPQYMFIGAGAGTYSHAVRAELSGDHSAHNAYVSVVVELGLVGLVLFLVLLAVSFQHARMAPPAERKLLIILWLTLLVGLTPRAWEAKKATWLVFGLLNASAVAGAFARAPVPPEPRLSRSTPRRRPIPGAV